MLNEIDIQTFNKQHENARNIEFWSLIKSVLDRKVRQSSAETKSSRHNIDG